MSEELDEIRDRLRGEGFSPLGWTDAELVAWSVAHAAWHGSDPTPPLQQSRAPRSLGGAMGDVTVTSTVGMGIYGHVRIDGVLYRSKVTSATTMTLRRQRLPRLYRTLTALRWRVRNLWRAWLYQLNELDEPFSDLDPYP